MHSECVSSRRTDTIQLNETTSMSMWFSMVIILRWAAEITDWSCITCLVVGNAMRLYAHRPHVRTFFVPCIRTHAFFTKPGKLAIILLCMYAFHNYGPGMVNDMMTPRWYPGSHDLCAYEKMSHVVRSAWEGGILQWIRQASINHSTN